MRILSCIYCGAVNNHRAEKLTVESAGDECFWVNCDYCKATGPVGLSRTEAITRWNEPRRKGGTGFDGRRVSPQLKELLLLPGVSVIDDQVFVRVDARRILSLKKLDASQDPVILFMATIEHLRRDIEDTIRGRIAKMKDIRFLTEEQNAHNNTEQRPTDNEAA